MSLQFCCTKNFLKIWLLASQLLITIIYLFYFFDLVFFYEGTFKELMDYFPSQNSVRVGVGIIFSIIIYLILNTFCGCCLAWQAQSCCYNLFIWATSISIVVLVTLCVYSLAKYQYFAWPIILYMIFSSLSIYFAFKLYHCPEKEGYSQLLDEAVRRQLEEIYSYKGPQTQQEFYDRREMLRSSYGPGKDFKFKTEKNKKNKKYEQRSDVHGMLNFTRQTVYVPSERNTLNKNQVGEGVEFHKLENY